MTFGLSYFWAGATPLPEADRKNLDALARARARRQQPN